jgi:hypothetical protein
VEKGFDATVNWPGLDFQFRNNTDWPVFILASYGNRKITVNLYGMSLDADTRIDLESITTRTLPQPVETKYVINAALAPGESKTFSVKGLSSNAKVKSTGKLQAALSGDQLTISVPDEDIKSVEAATIVDEGAEKQLVVVIHPGIELVTAKNITPVKQAELVTNDIQQAVNFRGRNANVKVNFSKSHPAGTYSIWNCIRLSNQQNWTRVNVQLPQGGSEEVFRHMNSASEFLKSKFFGENGRGKFFWNFRNNHYYECVYHDLGKEFNSLDYVVPISNENYVEVAGTLILPAPATAYFDEMVKTLSGINHNKWYVDEHNRIK